MNYSNLNLGSERVRLASGHTPAEDSVRQSDSRTGAFMDVGKHTVLVIEDDAAVRPVIRAMYHHGGFKVLEAASGEIGFEIWQQQRQEIALVFTDIMLGPGMSGIDVARKMRSVQPDVKIIFASGYSSKISDLDFSTTVGNWFLPKPFPMAKLLEVSQKRLMQ